MATVSWDPDTYLDAVADAIVPVEWGDRVKDNLKLLLNPPQARAYHSTTQAVSSTTTTALTFNSERYDTDLLHDNSTNPTRMTCVKAGVHAMFGYSTFSGSSGGAQRSLFFRLNGVTTLAQVDLPRNGAAVTAVALSTEWKLALNDYVELCAYHDAGASLNLQPEFGMRWAGFG